jgi:hypothetical protein
MWSIYSGDPGVDIQHLILVSSCHIKKIEIPSIPTFALSRFFRDLVDSRNCVDPHGRVVSYLLTSFLCSSSLMSNECEQRLNDDRRAICNATRGIDAGRGVICHRGVSDGSDGARPL